jgi:hypothetical protein
MVAKPETIGNGWDGAPLVAQPLVGMTLLLKGRPVARVGTLAKVLRQPLPGGIPH